MLDPIAPHALSPSELKLLLAAEREGTPFFAYKDGAGRLAFFHPGHGDTLGRRTEMDLPIDWDEEVSGRARC